VLLKYNILFIKIPLFNVKSHTHNGIIAGKLNGVMPAQTPRGILNVIVSISRAIPDSDSPS